MFYGYKECEKIANKIWRGKFPKTGETKYADDYEFGIQWNRDYVMVKGEWEQITETLEMKYEKTDVTVGRFYVRRMAQ